MEYVVLKNSLNLLYVQLPEGFGSKFEVVRCKTQEDLENYLTANKATDRRISSTHFLVIEKKDENTSLPDGIFVRQGDFFKKISFSDIVWLEASRSYCYFHLADKTSRIIVTHPLTEVMRKLPSDQFIQIHRSFVINTAYVERFIGNLLYIGTQSFPISRKFKNDVMNHFVFLDSMRNSVENKDCPLIEPGGVTDYTLSCKSDEETDL